MAAQDPDEIRKRADFERLLTAARISRRRGDYAAAFRDVAAALELFPSDLDAREFAADLFFARGELQKAADAYAAILKEDKSRASAEESFAKVTLQLAEANRQRHLLQDMLEHPERHQMPPRNPVAAAVLSGIPGLGHIYCGEMVKGLVLFGISAISWLLFYALRPVVDFYPPEMRIKMFVQQISALAVLFLILAVIVQVYAIVNAAVVAERTSSEKSGT